MGRDTNNPAQASALPTAAQAAAPSQLWYCGRCTKLVLPPGSLGVLARSGERYCEACAQLQAGNKPVSAIFDRPDKVPLHNSPDGAADRQRKVREVPGPLPRKTAFVIAASVAVVVLGGVGIYRFLTREKPATVAAATNPRPLELKTEVLGTGSNSRGDADTKSLAATDKSLHVSETVARPPLPPRIGGLFGSMQPGDANSDATSGVIVGEGSNKLAKRPGDVAAAKIPVADRRAEIDAFDARLKEIAPLIESQKFSDARALLDGLTAHFSNAEWWKQEESRIVAASNAIREKSDAYEQNARTASEQAHAATSNDADQLAALENDWRGRLAAGGSTANAARRVLDSVRGARERLAREDLEARSKVFAETFEKLEKRPQTKLPKAELDTAFKSLHDLKAHMLADAALAERFGDRWAALSFELNLSRGAEHTLFHVDPTVGEFSEVLYDFKNVEQVAAWKFDGDGPNSGSIDFDETAKCLILKVVGEHHFDKNAGKHGPMATLPFYFTTAGWTFDADARALKVHNREKRDQLPCFGIMVSDGGSNTIRMCAREHRKNEMNIYARGVDDKDAVKGIAGKEEDKMRLRIVCSGSRIEFYAGNNSKVIGIGRTSINFEPKMLALYVETHDNEENTQIAFDNVKIAGVMDKAKISAAISLRRSEAVNAVKAELSKTFKAPSVLQKK